MTHAILIFKKEVKEMVRDKRVVYNAVFGPIFLIVLMIYLFGFVINTVSNEKKRTIHIVGSSPLPKFLDTPGAKEAFEVKRVDTIDAGQKLINEGKADVVLEVESPDPNVETPYPQEVIRAYFDDQQERPKILLNALDKLAEVVNKAALTNVMMERQIPQQAIEPIKIEQKPVPHPKSVGGFLAGFLPYLIVIWAFYGAFGSASEMVAGEKEKNTLETLLIVPVERTQIAIGKFLSLMVLSVCSMLSSFVGIVLMGTFGGKQVSALFPEGIHFSAMSIITILLIMLPLAAMFAGLLLAVSTRARNTRDCQTQLTLVSFVVLMPAIFSQFIGLTSFAKAAWVNFVPILNSATVLRSVLLSKTDWSAVGITVATSLVLAYLTTAVSIRLFKREEVLAKI